MTYTRTALLVLIAAAVAAPGAAHANPKALPFTYGTRTTATGGLEIEQYVDAIPMRLARELPDGSAQSTVVPRYALQTELEYGLTDDVELGFYLAFRQSASIDAPVLRFQGIKQRVRWRFSPPCWPVQMAAYGEIAEFNDEIELEEKLILERRFGAVTALANLWIEQEWYFVTDETKYIYNPTVGVTWEPHPRVQLGAEYWARGRFDSAGDQMATDETPSGARHYAGPTVRLLGGEHWLAVGAYVRLDHLGRATPVDDAYGRVWVRLIAGIGI